MRVGIIGSGGAGTATAWLIEGEHEVTVYERASVPGGHARTLEVERDGATHRVDDGFSWFSDVLYPAFMRLLEIHEIATRVIPMSLSVTKLPNRSTQVLPPTRIGTIARTVANVPWLIDLLRFNRALDRAVPIVREGNRALSVGAFIEENGYREPFASKVLRPMLSALWGSPYARIDDLAIYTMTKYLVFHRPSGFTNYPWHVVRDGAASYVAKVASRLRAEVRCNTNIVGLERDAQGWTVIDDRGERRSYDQVVFATGAKDAARVLADVPGVTPTAELLGQFEYYKARVATHGDRNFMPASPRDWCVANMGWDGHKPELTLWSGLANKAPIFTTYLADREPAQIDHFTTFNLPLPTADLCKKQAQLAERQGQDQLWFAGDWTHDFGSHEDAIQSAMRICRQLSPSSPRLAELESPRLHPSGQPLPGPAQA